MTGSKPKRRFCEAHNDAVVDESSSSATDRLQNLLKSRDERIEAASPEYRYRSTGEDQPEPKRWHLYFLQVGGCYASSVFVSLGCEQILMAVMSTAGSCCSGSTCDGCIHLRTKLPSAVKIPNGYI